MKPYKTIFKEISEKERASLQIMSMSKNAVLFRDLLKKMLKFEGDSKYPSTAYLQKMENMLDDLKEAFDDHKKDINDMLKNK
jgi:hypothetical protein